VKDNEFSLAAMHAHSPDGELAAPQQSGDDIELTPINSINQVGDVEADVACDFCYLVQLWALAIALNAEIWWFRSLHARWCSALDRRDGNGLYLGGGSMDDIVIPH
jgi:hypothetical protein